MKLRITIPRGGYLRLIENAARFYDVFAEITGHRKGALQMFSRKTHASGQDAVPNHSATRMITARILTQAGWVAGSLHVPGSVRVVDYLDRRQSNFIPMTDVILESSDNPIPFLDMHRNAIDFIAVPDAQELASVRESGIPVEHHVACLLRIGYLNGVIRVRAGMRLSDFLDHSRGFVPIFDCEYNVRDPWSNKVFKEHEPHLLLNTQAVIGFSEKPATPDGSPA